MIKIKVPSEAEIKKKIEEAFEDKRRRSFKSLNKAELNSLGKDFVSQMRQTIEKGLSPITPWPSRLPAYKVIGGKTYVDKVQNKFPSKRERPVNLTLSGDFLKSLECRSMSRGEEQFLDLRFRDFLSELKEVGHREGTNGQAKRPIIPSESGEDFIRPLRRFLEVTFRSILRASLARTK